MRLSLSSSYVAILLSSSLAGQTPLAFQGNAIAAEGDALPGSLAGETLQRGFAQTGNPCLSSQGIAAIHASARGGTVGSDNDEVVLVGASREDLVVAVREGSPEPSGTIPGARVEGSLSANVLVNDRGTLLLNLQLEDGFAPGIELANDSVLYVGTRDQLRILAREGNPVPGVPGWTYFSDFVTGGVSHTLNSSDDIAFWSRTQPSIREVLCYGGPAGVSAVLRKGEIVAQGLVIESVCHLFQLHLNERGQLLHRVRLEQARGTPPPTAANDEALWIYSPGSGYSTLVREGDPAPIPGTVFGGPSGNWDLYEYAQPFNDAGEAFLQAKVTGAVTPFVDDEGLFVFSNAGHRLVARRGSAAPQTAPGEVFQLFSRLSLSDAGQVLFQAQLDGPTITSSNRFGIWAGAPGQLQLVARDGASVPGVAGARFLEVGNGTLVRSENGYVVFSARLTTTTSTSDSLWSWQPLLGLRLVAMLGDPVIVRPGVQNALAIASVPMGFHGDGRFRCCTDDGTLLLRTTLMDQSTAWMTLRLDSIAAYPPRISIARGGWQEIYLDAQPAHAGETYFVLGSASGTSPGIALPPFHLPLNPDWFFEFSLAYPNLVPFVRSLGTLDSRGRGRARTFVPVDLPFPGFELDWSYLLLDAQLRPTFAGANASLALTL